LIVCWVKIGFMIGSYGHRLPAVGLVMSNKLPKISMIFGSGPSRDDGTNDYARVQSRLA
jgi:hypothetical protein